MIVGSGYLLWRFRTKLGSVKAAIFALCYFCGYWRVIR